MPNIPTEPREIVERAEWLRWRLGLLTASRLPALWDIHPYLDAADLHGDVFGRRRLRDEASHLRAGRVLEAAIASALAEDHPDWEITKATTFHENRELRLGCTPDFWLGSDGLIQTKSVYPWEWQRWRGQPPLAYKLQTLAEGMLTGRTNLVLTVMVRSSELPVYEFSIPRHEEAERRILATAVEWWRSQPILPLPADPEPLRRMLDDGSTRDFTGDNRLPELLSEHAALKADAKDIKGRLEDIETEIREKMGPAKFGFLDGWTIKLPTVNRKAYEVAATSYRQLTITQSKTGDYE